MAKKESEDFVEGESGFAVEAEEPEAVSAPESVPEAPAPAGGGPVFTRGDDGRLVDVSDQ